MYFTTLALIRKPAWNKNPYLIPSNLVAIWVWTKNHTKRLLCVQVTLMFKVMICYLMATSIERFLENTKCKIWTEDCENNNPCFCTFLVGNVQSHNDSESYIKFRHAVGSEKDKIPPATMPSFFSLSIPTYLCAERQHISLPRIPPSWWSLSLSLHLCVSDKAI